MFSKFISKLLLARQLILTEKEFKILEKNFYLQPMRQFLLLQKNFEKRFGKNGLEEIYNSSKQSFYEICKDMRKFSASDKTFFDAILSLINHFGFGEVEIVEMKEARVLIQVKSNFAKEYVKEFGRQKACVDYLLSGILAGFFSEYFKKDFDCEEKNCIAKGNAFCNFIIKPK
ncbi:MAG: V4R domain-containing protein [Candidatus Aenigmatarchaeota archaeon]